MKNHHAAVWLDHEQARVFLFHQDDVDMVKVHPEKPHHHISKSDPKAEAHFFEAVSKTLNEAAEFVVLGPGSAKLQFVKWVHKSAHALEPRLVGVETVDHPTDGQIVAYAKKYFRAADRMR